MVLRWLQIAVFLTLFSAGAIDAATRGITVNLKASEASGAASIGSVELYNKSYALVIGNDGYNNGWPRLSNAINDAEAIAEVLEERGFEVELHRDLNSDQLNSVFKRFFILKGDNPNARLFIWYAGHGATVDGEGYLVPVDAPVPNEGAAFKLSSIALRDFGTYMRQAVAKHAYAVFDSCFAGTVFTAQRAMPPSAITRATTQPVRQFLTSGDADQEVSDDGTFRELFIRAINGEERADANGDDYITASELGLFLSDRLTNLTEQLQTPRYGKLRDRNFDRGDFVFALPEGAVGSAGLEAPAAFGGNAEIMFWNSIKDSDDPREFDVYLKQYPEGAFTALAMVKKNSIRRRETKRLAASERFELIALDMDMEAAKVANVRRRPFTAADKVGRLDTGDRIWAVGETRTSDGAWYQIAKNGVELGFVFGSLLSPVDRIDEYISISPLPTPVPEGTVFREGDTSEEIVKSPTMEERLDFIVGDLIDKPNQTGAQTLDPVLDNQPGPSNQQAAQVFYKKEASMPETAGTEAAVVAAVTSESDLVSSPQPGMNQAAGAITTAPGESTPTGTPSINMDVYFSATDGTKITSPNSSSPPSNDETNAGSDIPLIPAESTPPISKQSQTATDTAQQPQITETSLSETGPSESSANENSLQGTTTDSSELSETATLDDAIALNADPTPSDNTPVEPSIGDVKAGPQLNAGASQAEPAAISQSGPTSTDSAAPSTIQTPEPTELAFVDATETIPAATSNMTEYARRYLAAAEGGDRAAQFTLGQMYQNGDQTDQNINEAIRWYRAAAQAGDIRAILTLAVIYDQGIETTRNALEAAGWFTKAAEMGNSDAQQAIGYMYDKGDGVIQSYTTASNWYTKAAEQGNVAAQNNLGRLYQMGFGVEKDFDQAIFWYEKAAAQGSEAAKTNLKVLLP